MIFKSMFAMLVITVLAFVATEQKASAQGCQPALHALSDIQALNLFWGTSVVVCRLPDGSGGAFANRATGIVTVDQSWLDGVAMSHGNWAAVGVLAHEWGHMVQGNVPGTTAAELQADCLAGVFLRGQNLPPSTIAQFAHLNLQYGDPVWSWTGHGLGTQRYNAAARGYNGLPLFNGSNLALICPLSAF